MSIQVGSYVTPNADTHQYYGQTGQIISINSGTGGATIDWDGDGVRDAGGGLNIANVTQAGKTDYHFQLGNQLVSKATGTFDMVVPVILAVVGVTLLVNFVKKLKRN